MVLAFRLMFIGTDDSGLKFGVTPSQKNLPLSTASPLLGSLIIDMKGGDLIDKS